MSGHPRSELKTQHWVITPFTDPKRPEDLDHRDLGDRHKRANNRPTEAELLRANLEERGYSDAHFSSVLSDMDPEVCAHVARRDKTRILKQAMMQELLTGKTRLL